MNPSSIRPAAWQLYENLKLLLISDMEGEQRSENICTSYFCQEKKLFLG